MPGPVEKVVHHEDLLQENHGGAGGAEEGTSRRASPKEVVPGREPRAGTV
ncbi:MAG: hypothetical protein QM820_26745 [Minicystis sp.]